MICMTWFVFCDFIVKEITYNIDPDNYANANVAFFVMQFRKKSIIRYDKQLN